MQISKISLLKTEIIASGFCATRKLEQLGLPVQSIICKYAYAGIYLSHGAL